MRHCASVKVQPQFAGLRVEFVERHIFCSGVSLLRSTPGRLAGALGVLRKICPVSSKVSTFHIADGKAKDERISVS